MKVLRYLAGPEVVWILVWLMAGVLKKSNNVQTGRYNGLIESTTLLPVALLVLTMCLFFLPAAVRPHLMLRIALAAIIGTHFLMSRVLAAHTEGGPGVGTIYILAYILILIAVPVAAVVKALVFK